MPILKYDQLREALEDAADRAALREVRASGEEFFPDSLVERLWSGASRVLIWRGYRGLSATELARRAKVPKAQPLPFECRSKRHLGLTNPET